MVTLTKHSDKFNAKTYLIQNSSGKYLRVCTLSIDKVMKNINKRRVSFNFFGEKYEVNMNAGKFKLCKKYNYTCNNCGIVGTYFALEADISPKEFIQNDKELVWRLHLYALNDQGQEIQLTRDHIQPKSKGGGDRNSNVQLLCYPCNYAKNNNIITPELIIAPATTESIYRLKDLLEGKRDDAGRG